MIVICVKNYIILHFRNIFQQLYIMMDIRINKILLNCLHINIKFYGIQHFHIGVHLLVMSFITTPRNVFLYQICSQKMKMHLLDVTPNGIL